MNRKSVIRTVDDEERGQIYMVDLYENGKLVQVRDLGGYSVHYAQDLAENWETGVIQFLNEEG